MAVADLFLALEPVFIVADKALAAREALREAMEVERGLIGLRSRAERARVETETAEAEAGRAKDRAETAKVEAERETARHRKERLEAIERQREDVRREIVRLNAEQQEQRAKTEGIRRQAAEAERDHQATLGRFKLELEEIQRERDVRRAEREALLADLERRITERQVAYREVVERIASLAPR